MTFTNVTYQATSLDAVTFVCTELYSYLNRSPTISRVTIAKAWRWNGSLSKRNSSHFSSYSWSRIQSSRI